MKSTRSVIVGTAGHIDHGKSTLVEALTGTHPDRLEEEKRRGITIDLGFAFLEASGVRFAFVDVPGHERFVKNMLAGAWGVDVLLLVIAADEVIKPQTREHFDICRLLGVERGVIALTKIDRVDEDTQELARLEVEEFVQGSFLSSARIVPVSAKTGAGLSELKEALLHAANEVAAKDPQQYFRLPIDRSFSVKGFGTVVTGTLVTGQIRTGQEVELLPAVKKLRVRGLQTGGKAVERSVAGERTAVNLAGVEHADVKRGMTLAAPGRFRGSRRIDVRLELLSSAQSLKHRAKVHFHSGTSEAIGEVLLYEEAALRPRETGMAQIRLEDEIVAVRGDRFIVRQFSPVMTIGGGVVLDPMARRPTKKDTGRVTFLETVREGTREEILRAIAERNVLGVAMNDLVARTGWLENEIQAVSENLAKTNLVRIVSREPLVLFSEKLFAEICEKLATRVERFHKENPLLPGIAREELRANLGKRVRPEAFQTALQELTLKRKLVVEGEVVKKIGTEITLTAEEARAKEQISGAFLKAGLTVPSAKEVLLQLTIESRHAEKILQILLRDQVLVRVSPELVFHAETLQQLGPLLQAHKKS
ncbi:MAG TPA: selenocysteine-specific translation elongation factor, partial [Candidatus Acidoferrum sp.]